MSDRCKWCVKAFLIAAIGCGGCSPCASKREIVHSLPPRNLIFNPSWTGIGSFPVARSGWPDSVAYSHPFEEVYFQETRLDRQGRIDEDVSYYRRFDSIRFGSHRR